MFVYNIAVGRSKTSHYLFLLRYLIQEIKRIRRRAEINHISDERQYNIAYKLENSRQRPIGKSLLLCPWLSLPPFLLSYEDDTHLCVTLLRAGQIFRRKSFDLWNVLTYYLPEIQDRTK